MNMQGHAQPLVSIVLATNRASPFLEATLQSVSGQSWQRWELIIVDDGGPDPSSLDELAKTVPNCVVIHRQCSGVAMARNVGVAASRGEFLVFLDDDDIWHPDRLLRQIAEFGRDPDAVACYSSGWHMDADGAELPYAWPPTGATREQLLSGAIGIPRIVTMMVRRDPFIAVGCFNTAIKAGSDLEWTLRLLRHGRFVCSPDALVGYRHHGSSMSSAPLADRLLWYRRGIQLQLWATEASANQDDQRLMRQNMRMFRRRIAEVYLGMAVGSAKSGHALRASGEVIRALGWSAPRAASAAAARLGRFARRHAVPNFGLPTLRDACVVKPRGSATISHQSAAQDSCTGGGRGGHAVLPVADVTTSRGSMTPRISAYVLAADPAWLEQSIHAYYELAQRIVVSYDESRRSWTGQPLPIDACLARLKAADPDGKLDFRPGDYARTEHHPLENDTYQRQQALQQASDGADWVIQLDTDEVVANIGMFRESLMEADAGDYDALVYPARQLYQRVSDGLFLEHSSRLWRRLASYPGPVAVRAGVKLRNCRQGGTNLYVVGFSYRELHLYHLPAVRVRKVISVNDAILHFSWIRSDQELATKLTSSPYAHDRDRSRLLGRWRQAARHPLRTAALTPLQPDLRDRLRISRIPGW